MGQAGAQREPSMEEILASIRRIIENNEPGADGNPVDAGAAFKQFDADDSSYDAEPALQEAESQRTAANDAPVAQPVSLADVAARARAVPDTHSADTFNAHADAGDKVAVRAFGGGEVNGFETSDNASEVMDAAAEELREALTSDEPVEAIAPAAAAAVKPVEAEPVEQQPEPVAQKPEPVAQQPEPVKSDTPADDREPPAEEASGGQLVSLQTVEKVAAAFGELDAAVAAGQRRSFDEIAEEMLRPMLTQWLDDNLPTLVERLVREEIERVSRGNRR
ncbi:DUF2497 domain-containing protein [Hoeflea sp. AS16]|uniref:PopZ family protein n=1 Tax=Hoeflea sp. AS16 TaxID=3135779 RepID=UPI00317BD7DB